MTISGCQRIHNIQRSKEERLALMKKDISENDNVVISGSLVDWGDELIPLFTLAIRLVTDLLLCVLYRTMGKLFG